MFIFICFAAAGLSWSTRHLQSSPWHAESEPKARTEAWRGGGWGWPKNEWRAREAGPRNDYK